MKKRTKPKKTVVELASIAFGESSVPIVFETMTLKKRMLIIFLYLMLTLILLFVTNSGPSIWKEKHSKYQTEKSFPLVMNGSVSYTQLKRSNYKVFVYLTFQPDNLVEDLDVEAETYIQVYCQHDLEADEEFNKFVSERLYSEYYLLRRLQCKKKSQKCNKIRVFPPSRIRFENYRFVISVTVNHYEQFLSSFEIVSQYRTKNSMLIEAIISIFLTLISILLLVMRRYSIKNVDKKDLNTEQKWLRFLIPMLIFFNLPINFVLIVWGSVIPEIVESVTMLFFACMNILFFICTVDNMRVPFAKRKFWKHYLPKYILISPLFALLVYISVQKRIHKEDGATVIITEHQEKITKCYIAFFVLTSIYLLWIIIACIATARKLRNIPRSRSKFYLFIGLSLVHYCSLIIFLIIEEENDKVTNILNEFFKFHYTLFFAFLTYLFLPTTPTKDDYTKIQNDNKNTDCEDSGVVEWEDSKNDTSESENSDLSLNEKIIEEEEEIIEDVI
ncbi:transmembrane protein [Anaeramoeba flamelloides]|uniref:Transmembrane protein n=1 Tax=Anaeramoeba flamelloides TaxID=1746091 RepID=A0AAV7Y6U4_9EUKA|nr:transmembrane protein [Anaeramoeba flamelloides]KAJ6236707.1 transmembrane protein [Anaeramoeba flamelloides]